MENPDDEINQLLSKIQELESKNAKMRTKIEEKEKELRNPENFEKSKPAQKKNIKKEKKIITIEEDRKAALRFKNEINFLNNNSLQIKDNLEDKVIEFDPKERYGVMYITGDFTGWEPQIMQKNKDCFYFQVVLIKGFKYYYTFQSNEETIIDYSKTFEENPYNLQLQNYIDLYQKKDEPTNYFDYKTDINILKSAQRNYLLLKVDDDIDNSIFLDKFQRHILALQPESNNNDEQKIKDSINFYYDDLFKKIDSYDKTKYEKLKLYFKNRILVHNSPKMKDVQYECKILDISTEDNSFICMRLYDHNKIKLNSVYYSDYEKCWKIPFDEVVLKPPNNRDKLYHLLSLKESQKIIKDFEDDTEDIITAYFDDLDNLNQNSKSLARKYGKKSNLEELVRPKKVDPDDVDLNDYEYYYSNNEIVKIRNKDDNSYIEYQIVEEKKKYKRKKEIKEEKQELKKEEKQELKKEEKQELKKEEKEKDKEEVKDLNYKSKYSKYKYKYKANLNTKEKEENLGKEQNENTEKENSYKKKYMIGKTEKENSNSKNDIPEYTEKEKNYYKKKYIIGKKEKEKNSEKKEEIEENIEKEKKIEKKEVVEKKEKKLIEKKEKKPAQYLVYYTFYNNKVLILHCHILDKAFKYKKIKIKEIGDNVDPHILKKDKLHINSYDVLLITKSTGPIKLYFKGKKVQMESKLISQNKLYKIDSPNEFNSIFHQMVVSICPIKNSKSLNYDLLEKCKEKIYNGKDILNGIDVKVEYNNTFDENMMLAVSPCLLREISPEEENSLKNQKKPEKKEKKEKKSYEMQKFELIGREMAKYRKYTKEAINKMTRSENDNIAITLDDYKSTMDMICNYVQEKELWDMIEQVSVLTNEIENLLQLFDN